MSKANRAKPTKDVWEFLGFSERESADLRLRVMIYDRLRQEIYAKKLTPRVLEKRLNEPQPRISDLMNGKLEKFSSDKLFQYLEALAPEKKFFIDEKTRRTPGKRAG
jgi:predicted XRE-type DNA-binding protein